MHLIWSTWENYILAIQHLSYIFLFVTVQFWTPFWRRSWLWCLTSISHWAPSAPGRGGSAWPPTSSPSSGSLSTWTRRPSLTTATASSWRAATSGARGHYDHCHQINTLWCQGLRDKQAQPRGNQVRDAGDRGSPHLQGAVNQQVHGEVSSEVKI